MTSENYRKLAFVLLLPLHLTMLSAQTVSFDARSGTNTHVVGISYDGTIAGFEDVGHGFIRDPSGQITEFDPAGSVDTMTSGIASSGFITGAYYDSSFTTAYGFVRTPEGVISPPFVPANGLGVSFASINDQGIVAGSYLDLSLSEQRGFVRDATGGVNYV